MLYFLVLAKSNIEQLQLLQNSAAQLLHADKDQKESTHYTNFKVSALATCELQNWF